MRLITFLLLQIALAYPSLAVEPPLYPYTDPADITLEDVIPAAMDNLKQPGYVQGMKAGEKILIVTDRSVEPLSAEAFYVAAWRLGASQVDTIISLACFSSG